MVMELATMMTTTTTPRLTVARVTRVGKGKGYDDYGCGKGGKGKGYDDFDSGQGGKGKGYNRRDRHDFVRE